jgi:rhomboid family GlyGly-CTERM serine protease
LRALNCDGRHALALCLVLAALWLAQLGGARWQAALRYERHALASGQWWRLASAHLVHLNWRHALLNGAALVLLWILFAREFSPARWLAIVLASAACIDAGLWFLEPQVEWYVGSSGVLHGVLAAGALAQCRRRERLGMALMLLLLAKLAYEQLSGASLFIGALPVVLRAHLYGAIGGVLAALMPARAAEPL